MPKPQLEFGSTESIPWSQQANAPEGMLEKVLAVDAETGDLTRLTKWEAETDTSSLGVQMHPYREEIFIIEGALHDLTLRKTFGGGHYACRPPAMRHGPWTTAEGAMMLEIRTYV